MASDISDLLTAGARADMISFAGGMPEPDLFPIEAFDRAQRDVFAEPSRGGAALQYTTCAGYQPLRAWIAQRMTAAGCACGPDNIVITSGAQQALSLSAKLFLSKGDTALVTAPTYMGALQAFGACEPRYDELHLDAAPAHSYREHAARAGSQVRLAYIVPDFANPTGRTLSLAVRRKLLALTRELNIPLVEDAAYVDLGTDHSQVPSCAALAAQDYGIEGSHVVYCGTFSKTLAPGFRVGWICARRDVADMVALAKQGEDVHSSTFGQVMLHEVASAGFEDQLKKVRRTYEERRRAMLQALAQTMPPGVTWTRPQGGLFVWVTLPEHMDARGLLVEAHDEARVAFVPGQAFFANGGGRNMLRLSYSMTNPRQIQEGVARLAALIQARL